LASVVATERARLTTKIERSLSNLDLKHQKAARLGIVRTYDQETRNLRSNARHADRRHDWASRALKQLRTGVNPTTIIDPKTKCRIAPVPPSSATSPTVPAAPAAPAPEAVPSGPAEPASSFPEPEETTIRLLAWVMGLPEELRQMFILMAEAQRRTTTPDAEEPLLRSEPAEEPGPGDPG
jgi:hypothetical protein